MSIDKYETLNQERMIRCTKRKVAAYCRVSTDNEDQANSFESQQRYFRQYIERNPDWELYEVFADEGISGTNTKKRKEFNRMIACAKNGDFDLIVTKEISRFARNTLDSIFYTRDLKKHGVGVIFLNDNINTLDGDAELRLAIMSSIAQEESRKTSERVKWGQKRQMERGVVFGRDMLGYDVRGGKMYINEEGAKIVRLIFHKFVNEKKGTHVIARELFEAGIKPMRVKEWQNTVILRIIRNEKYCGDLVQKKTYTPDFLSHEKKVNLGQEEFVIIKDHHDPIIPREMFDEANRMLDERSSSQTGKAKYSGRYPFSGKIKCGCCGLSYVARYKTRKNGSCYKAWRCLEAVRHGSPHIDKAGNQVGCRSLSIRNEDVAHIMYLLTRSLQYNKKKFTDNLVAVIKYIISSDSPCGAYAPEGIKGCPREADSVDADSRRRKAQLMAIEEKRTNLIDLYTSGDISKDEFTAAREKYAHEIARLQSVIDDMPEHPGRRPCEVLEEIDRQRENHLKQQALVVEITEVINELVNGVEYEDDFYKEILDKMVVYDKDHIDVYLNRLPLKWSYTTAKGVNCMQNERHTGEFPCTQSEKSNSEEAVDYKDTMIPLSDDTITGKGKILNWPQRI
ncbi:recombinase family protein [Lachnospiraceae bacterium]|nr:recombinase family protein [Lachnospiraceae bacterium]